MTTALGFACEGAAEPTPVPPPIVQPETPPQVTQDEPAPPTPVSLENAPPEGFVDLEATIPGLRTSIGYHQADNFTGTPLPGYAEPGAWLREEPAAALGRVQQGLAEEGLGLLVYDAYRPARASQAMVAWAERADRVDLLDNGYVARKSGHNHGHTVDLTLCKLDSGEPLDMGTPWDTLDERAHTRNAEGAVLENRLKLKAAMEKQGWKPYSKEWWHFGFALPGSTARDVPYACYEPQEGAFVEPEGWSQVGWVPTVVEAPSACP